MHHSSHYVNLTWMTCYVSNNVHKQTSRIWYMLMCFLPLLATVFNSQGGMDKQSLTPKGGWTSRDCWSCLSNLWKNKYLLRSVSHFRKFKYNDLNFLVFFWTPHLLWFPPFYIGVWASTLVKCSCLSHVLIGLAVWFSFQMFYDMLHIMYGIPPTKQTRSHWLLISPATSMASNIGFQCDYILLFCHILMSSFSCLCSFNSWFVKCLWNGMA
jgi:hypothetical protein